MFFFLVILLMAIKHVLNAWPYFVRSEEKVEEYYTPGRSHASLRYTLRPSPLLVHDPSWGPVSKTPKWCLRAIQSSCTARDMGRYEPLYEQPYGQSCEQSYGQPYEQPLWAIAWANRCSQNRPYEGSYNCSPAPSLSTIIVHPYNFSLI